MATSLGQVNDTALVRGVRTFLQAILTFLGGLVVAVWNVPGVPEAVHTYVTSQGPGLLFTIGLPLALGTGAVSFLWNVLRKDVPNV